MSEQINHPPDHESLAQVIQLRSGMDNGNDEPTSPEQLTDARVVHRALSVLRHPTTSPEDVAERLTEMLIGATEGDWTTRFKTAIANINISDELYDTLSADHPPFQQMRTFLEATKDDQIDLPNERKAVVALMDMYGLAASDESGQLDQHDVDEVFQKLLNGLNNLPEIT